MMHVVLFLVMLLACNASTGDVIFEDCGSEYELEMVSIEGCRLSLPCYITVGETPEVVIEFKADFTSRYLDQDVVITLNFVNMRTDVTPEPCATSGCPVSTSSSTHITSKMSVPRSMALNQRGYLRWRVYNEKQQMVLCYRVLVQTQSGLQKQMRQLLEIDEPFNETVLNNMAIDIG